MSLLAADPPNYPGKNWERRSPEQVGLSQEKLAALAELAGGRGCVVRHGYMVFTWGDQGKSSDVASAFKPLLTTLLFMAIQEGRLASVDDKVADFEPRLKSLNGGKDAAITWRHFAFQTSGYSLAETPGVAYSYNDYAPALYYDTLTHRVFGTNGTAVLKARLAEPLQFEDNFTFDAFRNGPSGRLALSVRDFARFGLLYLRNGKWRDQQLLKREFVRQATDTPLSLATPLTSGEFADMLPEQRSIGGTRNITPVGPGYYSFNWWLNRTNQAGKRLFVDALPDAFVASGHGGMRTLWILPSLDLIVCWNDSKIEDHDQSPGNPNTKCNQAARLMVEAATEAGQASGLPARLPASVSRIAGETPGVAGWKPAPLASPERSGTVLGIQGAQFTLNRKPTFLFGLSYYGGLGASETIWQKDLADMKRYGFNWIRVWATWSSFTNDVSAVDAEGNAREPFLSRLKKLVLECDQRGMVVDITLSRGNGMTGGPSLQTLAAHRRAAETLVTALKAYRNWYLDLSNERNIRDKRFTSFDDLKELREVVRKLDSDRLVTASHGGDISYLDLIQYLQHARLDFICPHRPREPEAIGATEEMTQDYLSWMKEIGRLAPVHYQEPFRRGYAKWQPAAADFVADARHARDSGAAGWCFHNGDQRTTPGSRPRRSFDLRKTRLFEQLDEEEMKALEELRTLIRTNPR